MINIAQTENFLKQQASCLDMLTELIAYDKEHGEPPENTKLLTGFIDTQRKALDMAAVLLKKHKPALESAEKAEREKQQAQAKIEAAKRKEEQKKAQVEKDRQKANTDENSLFCAIEETDEDEGKDTDIDETLCREEAADDGYSFEETDNE